MKIGDQVCTFKQAKLLKEFGIFQNSVFYYFEHEVGDIDIISSDILEWKINS